IDIWWFNNRTKYITHRTTTHLRANLWQTLCAARTCRSPSALRGGEYTGYGILFRQNLHKTLGTKLGQNSYVQRGFDCSHTFQSFNGRTVIQRPLSAGEKLCVQLIVGQTPRVTARAIGSSGDGAAVVEPHSNSRL